jgi:hypothetical protein
VFLFLREGICGGT